VFFFADDSVHGLELWTSDGTSAGTQMVADLLPGSGEGVRPGTLAQVGAGAAVAFGGTDGVNGLQPWLSDGSLVGTVQLGRIGTLAGSGAATLASFTLAGDKLVFLADDGILGEELWAFPFGGSQLAFATPYGTGCRGSSNVTPRIAAGGLPRLANSAFTIDLTNARAGATAFVELGFQPLGLPLGSGCTLLLLPSFSLPPIVTDGAGFGRTSLPIPADPALVGGGLYGQYVVVDPGAAFQSLIALTNGLQMTLGR
jgi:ELWxxDGT repeat protein